MFETERDENTGDAFNGTFGFTGNYYNIRASSADLIALSTVVAVGSCGGPKIPFRAGRIDATEAGPLGVPKPDQDIDTHTQIFAKAGFNTSDMITMVACGHTLGGIHGKDFPEITFNEAETNFEHFEGNDSFSSFDNDVVTKYLDGTTPNMLAVGKNETTNSDKRVFNADGNSTMKALADPDTFQSQCASILARMIDTVPSDVKLTDPIEPIVIKPDITSFGLINATHLTLSGRIRVLSDADSYTDQVVSLIYTPHRANSTLNTTIATTRATLKLGTTDGLFGELFTWHEFETTLPASTSISAFDVSVTRISTGEVTVYDNAGTGGYPLDDGLLYQTAQSCKSLPAGADAYTSDYDLTVGAAVRKDVLGADEKVAVEVVIKKARQGVYLPALEVERWEEAEGAERKEVGDWVVVQVKGKLNANSVSTTFDVVVGEGESERRVEFQKTTPLGDECATF